MNDPSEFDCDNLGRGLDNLDSFFYDDIDGTTFGNPTPVSNNLSVCDGSPPITYALPKVCMSFVPPNPINKGRNDGGNQGGQHTYLQSV